MCSKVVFFALFFTFAHCVYAAESNALNSKMITMLHKYNIPGASIAVVEQGKLIWAKGFGYADLATKRSIEVDTLFQACSITKSLTSVAVLQVLKKYRISLDAPVNVYLKRWQIPVNQYTKHHPVTIRMLLNHTAAISNPYPDGGYAYDAILPTLNQVLLGRPPATNPPIEVIGIPNKTFAYCNGCYAILQLFLEDVTGVAYPKLMQKLILERLKMTNSEFNNTLFLHFPNRFALPYDNHEHRFIRAPITSPIYATGLLLTTPSDLAKFAIAIQQSLNTDHGFLPQGMAKNLITPSSTHTRGLGFFISDKEGHEKAKGHYFMHSGNNIGYLTLLIGSLDGKHAAVFMINISPEWNAKQYPQFEFINGALKLIAHEYHWK